MMITTATRLAAFVICFLFGAGGAAIYWLVGDTGKALPHAVLWFGLAWIVQPGRDDSEAFYKWLDAKAKEEGIAA